MMSNQDNLRRQLLAAGVHDVSILDALNRIPRSDFVRSEYRSLAYTIDSFLPLFHSQFMLSPLLEAQILVSSEVKPTDIVLLIGTGSGYLAAVLSLLAQFVYTIEIDADIASFSAPRLRGRGNVSWDVGNIFEKDLSSLKVDLIIWTGALSQVPTSIFSCLNLDGGRMITFEKVLTEVLLSKMMRYSSSNNDFSILDLDIFASIPFMTGSCLLKNKRAIHGTSDPSAFTGMA